jgi:hypothetical protein
LHHEKNGDKPSTIIKLTSDSQVKIIRKWFDLKIWKWDNLKINYCIFKSPNLQIFKLMYELQ